MARGLRIRVQERLRLKAAQAWQFGSPTRLARVVLLFRFGLFNWFQLGFCLVRLAFAGEFVFIYVPLGCLHLTCFCLVWQVCLLVCCFVGWFWAWFGLFISVSFI